VGSEDFPGLTDIHAHPAMNSFLWGRDLRRHYWTGHHFNPLASLTDFKMLEKGGVKVLWSSLHIPERQYFGCWYIWLFAHLFSGGRKLLKRDAWECLLLMMAKMEDQVGRSGDRFEVAGSNEELDKVVKAGRTAIVHTVEGGHVLGAGLDDDDLDGRLARVDELAERGVASLTLAHLFPNDLAGHAEGIPKKQRESFICPLHTEVELSRGLTAAGEAVVQRMVDRRMIPDVTHCTPGARARVYELVAKRIPVIASHNGVQTMNRVPYNLEESDVRAIRDSDGVVGVIFMPYWLDEANPGKGLDAIWRTMEKLHEWSGGTWKHVAVGTDFDGFTDPPDDCKNASELPLIRELLVEKGVSSDDADAILGGNARRVLRAGWR
jgi:microsomal dipeptidase-like Zn-dependent dipeptidase